MKTLKKILCTFLVIIMCLTSAPLGGFVGLELPEFSVSEWFASKASAASEGYYTYTITDGESTITDVDTSISGDITIPATLGGYSVTSIGDYAFYSCYSLTSVTIPDSVTTIGERAFAFCDSLTSIVVDINNSAYSNDSRGVLFNKKKTILIQYPAGNTGTSYTIPDSVTYIGDMAFYYCDSLTSVTIPDSVTTIGDYAFHCESLTSVTIPDSVTTIGDYAFAFCYNLTSVTIPDSVTTIGDRAFYYCESLTSVTIPDSVTTIGDMAFYNCWNLTSVTIPDSVTFIGDRAFYCCDSLTSVTIPDSVTTIGERAFADCDSLTSVTIPDSVTTIGDYAFYYCDSLTSVTIPDSVTTIGDRAFYNCDSLTSIVVDINNSAYSNDSRGVLFNKNKTILIQYPIGNTGTSYTIPDSVTTIGDNAFYYCTNLTSVTIPDSVTAIGDYAFASCDSLTSVTIPDSVTAIGDCAFTYCDSLTSVTIGDSVTTIGDYAFNNCESLTDVYYQGTEKQWNNIIIEEYNDELLDATIHFLGEDEPDEPETPDEPKPDGYRLQLRSAGRYSDSIAIGNTIEFYTYLSENGKLLDCERAYAISFDNPGIFDVVETEITEPSFDVTLKAKKVGTTNMTISDNITGAYVTIRLKANNPKEIITMDEVKDLAKEYQKDKLTNFYDYNGLYIDGYFYKEYRDGSYRVYMNAYNEKAYYGAVVSYDKNGNIVDHRLIKPQDKLPTSIWSGFIDSIDVIDDHLKKFKDKYLYDEPTFTKHSDVDELKVPEDGYFVITNNYLENEYVFFANTIDIALDLMFAYSSTKKVDIPDSLSEKVVEKTIKDLLEEIGKDALKSIYKKMIKVFTKGITIDNVDAFMSTLVGVFKEYEIDFEGMIKEVVDDLNDTETKLDFAEDALLTILGAGTVKAVLSSLGYINTAIKLIDIFSGSLSSEILIYTPPEEEKTRTSNGVKVTSETPLDPDYVLHSYIINEADDVMVDAKPTIEALTSNYQMYDITLYKSSQAVQPTAKITVMIPIPAGYNKNNIQVYWYKADGTLESMNAEVQGDYAVFETDHLSYYVLVEEQEIHSHSYEIASTVNSTCTETGTITYTCSCGDSYTETVPAAGHSFADGQSKCNNCDYDKADSCSCKCHKSGIAKIIFKIILFFQKLFRKNQICEGCGVYHY